MRLESSGSVGWGYVCGGEKTREKKKEKEKKPMDRKKVKRIKNHN